MFLGPLAGEDRYQRRYRSISPHDSRKLFCGNLSPDRTAVYFRTPLGHCRGIPIAAGKPAGPAVGSRQAFSDLTFEGILGNREEFPEKAQG
jgi:hypothetical protein